MSHLGENLASKGYVVVSIDHTDSTYDDQQAFASTLYNRPLDQLLVLREMARLSASGSGSFLDGLVDASRTGLVGYSMGGYGVVNTIGGGFSQAAVTMTAAPPQAAAGRACGVQPGLSTARSIPASRRRSRSGRGACRPASGMPTGSAGIRTPVLFVAGSADDVSGYEKGTRAMFEARGQRRPLPADVRQRQPQRGGAVSRRRPRCWRPARRPHAYTHYAEPCGTRRG